MKSGARVLLVYGSETNTTKRFVHELISPRWKKKDDEDIDIHLEIEMGDDAADRWDEITRENYDFLVVATSSYAEGDPPTGFGRFLFRLQETAREFDGNAANVKPLWGIRHAVLGVGNTQYDTFQNIPRHVDRYLGMCGSGRCKRRLEWDEMESTETDITEWADEMAEILRVAAAEDGGGGDETAGTAPEVCSWEEPSGEIFEKTVGEDGWEDPGRTQFEITPWMMVAGFLVIVAGGWYNKHGEEYFSGGGGGAAASESGMAEVGSL